jgi:hypothetical protein
MDVVGYAIEDESHGMGTGPRVSEYRDTGVVEILGPRVFAITEDNLDPLIGARVEGGPNFEPGVVARIGNSRIGRDGTSGVYARRIASGEREA